MQPDGQTSFDLVVIGSGPGGQRAAIQASKAGKSVALVEGESEFGGACLFQGTVPSKCFRESIYRFSLSQSGALRHDIDQSHQGVTVELPDMQRLWKRRDRVTRFEAQVIHNQLSRNRVKLIQGWAKITGPDQLEVATPNGILKLKADKMVIATGARPMAHAKFPVDGKYVFDSNSILALDETPKSIIVLGAGVIGCEYASMFLMAGSKVTLVDRSRETLQFIDREIVDHLVARFQHFHMKIMTGHDPDHLKVIEKNGKKQVAVTLKSGEVIEADTALVTMGRLPNVEKLGVRELGLEFSDRGYIVVNKHFQTKIPNIYAVGDVIGFPALASTSTEQGRIACCHAFQIQSQTGFDLPKNYPYGIYTIPEISTVGLSEEEVQKQGIPYAVGRAHYGEVVRSQIVGDRWGLLKMVIDRRDLKILGVHIIGDNSTEIVHIGQAVMTLGGSVKYFIENVFNYPTYAEAYKVAALSAVNHALKS